MKKKVLTALCTGLLGASVMISGATGVMAAQETKAEETTAREDEKELKELGEKRDGDFEVELVNSTEKIIKGFEIKVDHEDAYGENLLKEGDVFAADEERMLYMTPAVVEKEEGSEEEKIPMYDIQLTFEDDTTAVLHTFPFGDVEKCEICLEDGVAYLIFDSLSRKDSVNTLQTEQDIIAAAQAQAAAEAAAAEAAAQAAAAQTYEQNYDYHEEDYSDYSYDGGGGDTGGQDACLDGGLLY